MADLREMFFKHDDEFLKFDRVQSKLSERADLHAFMLLDKLVPSSMSILGSANHDEVYLGVDCDDLSKVATEEDIVDLVRSGVRYSSECNSLCMYV